MVFISNLVGKQIQILPKKGGKSNFLKGGVAHHPSWVPCAPVRCPTSGLSPSSQHLTTSLLKACLTPGTRIEAHRYHFLSELGLMLLWILKSPVHPAAARLLGLSLRAGSNTHIYRGQECSASLQLHSTFVRSHYKQVICHGRITSTFS